MNDGLMPSNQDNATRSVLRGYYQDAALLLVGLYPKKEMQEILETQSCEDRTIT
jgi:hypothetical protein